MSYKALTDSNEGWKQEILSTAAETNGLYAILSEEQISILQYWLHDDRNLLLKSTHCNQCDWYTFTFMHSISPSFSPDHLISLLICTYIINI